MFSALQFDTLASVGKYNNKECPMNLEALDLTVVAVYAVMLLVIAQWVSREKAGHSKDTSDYFLAGRALPWWAIGASLIAGSSSSNWPWASKQICAICECAKGRPAVPSPSCIRCIA